MIQAIFFDVDGTLLSLTNHNISPAVLDALYRLREKGIKLFLATGRHKSMVGDVLSRFPFDGYITLNGQYCFCGDQVLRSVPLDRKDMEHIVEATSAGAFSCIFMAAEDSFLNQPGPYTDLFPNELSLPLPRIEDPHLALETDIFQLVAFVIKEDEHLLTDQTQHVHHMRWHPHFVDAIADGGGKDKGIDVILDHWKIPLENSMAFGDGENDLSMLTHVGIGVAMGAANDLVNSQADYVTGSVDEDGILTALQHFGLL